jgi:cob(I)alamin adenosyltransferase
MSFFTGKGDDGSTKLFDSKGAERVSKTSPIFETLGMLDELNSVTGWCRVACTTKHTVAERTFADVLRDVQDHLFTMQAEVAGAPKQVPQTSVEMLGEMIGKVERSLPKVTTFLVPGGTEISARLDIARAVSRRVERRLVQLHESGERNIQASSRAYANRLSSLFYALTRLANRLEEIDEESPRYKDNV